jgi:hypothetical protein
VADESGETVGDVGPGLVRQDTIGLIGAHANGEYGDPVGERMAEVVAPGVGLPPAADADRVRVGSGAVASGDCMDELSDPCVVGADLQNPGFADRRVTVQCGWCRVVPTIAAERSHLGYPPVGKRK